MRRKSSAQRPVALLALTLLLLLPSTCKNRTDPSNAASADDGPTVSVNRVTGTADMWEIGFPDTGSLKAGQTAFLSWGVASNLPEDEIECGGLPNKLEPVTFEEVASPDERRFIGFKKQIDPAMLKRCDDSDPAGLRKISLQCMNSGDWSGVKRLEGCVYFDAAGTQLAGKGWGTPNTSALEPEPKKNSPDTTLGLAGPVVEDINVNVNYGKICAEKLGKIPAFDCVKDGQIIPITLDGVETPFGARTPTMACDKPIYLGLGDQGQCVPYARLGRLPSLMPDGNPNPDVDTVFICRRYKITDKVGTRDVPRKANVKLHEDVAIIQHSRKTGETCWYQGLSGFQAGNKSLPTGRVPPPYEDELPEAVKIANRTLPAKLRAMRAKDFWIQPNDSRGFNCVKCHDSDPFMLSPYSAQVKFTTPEGVKDYVLPCDPFTPKQLQREGITNTCAKKDGKGLYSQVSKLHSPPNWPNLVAIAPKDPATSKCVSCHRIGAINTCKSWMPDSVGLPGGLSSASANQKSASAKRYPLNHWMPLLPGMPATAEGPSHSIADLVSWERDYKKSADAIAKCCTEYNPNAAATAQSAAFSSSCTVEQISSTPPATVSGTTVVLKAGPVPAAIPDNSPAGVTLALTGTIPPTAKILAVAADINISHTYQGQLRVVLKKQGEADVLLYDGSQSAAPATENVMLNVNSASYPSLNVLTGAKAAGNWSVQVSDSRMHETGQVTSFELKLTVDQAQ